jgi:hypothetical protein
MSTPSAITSPHEKLRQRIERRRARMAEYEAQLDEYDLPYYTLERVEAELLTERSALNSLLLALFDLGADPAETPAAAELTRQLLEVEMDLLQNAINLSWPELGEAEEKALWKLGAELRAKRATLLSKRTE